MKAIDFGMFGCEIHDVSVNHTFGDDAEWKELRGDTQHRQDVRVGGTPPEHNFSEQPLPRVVRSPAHGG